jgi:uncharacterized MAPEG superfamily protein
MNHVVLSVGAAIALPYLLTALAKSKGFGIEENKQTRAWQAQLTGWRQRAHWAHQNQFEVLPAFIGMAILAHLAQPDSMVAMIASWSFVGLRVLYSICYLADNGSLRSTMWFGSMGAVAVLMLVALSVV